MVLLRLRLVLGGGFRLLLCSKPLCDGAPLVRAAALVKLFRRPVRWWCSATGGDIGGHGGPGGLLCNFFICQGSLCSLVGSVVLSVSFAYVPVCVRVYVRFPYILIYTRFISKKSWLVTVQVLVRARRGQKYFARVQFQTSKFKKKFPAPAWRLKSRRNKKRIATAVCKWRDESNEPN